MDEGKVQQKTIEEWKELYLQRFKDFHDNFSDEIPEEILHGPNSKNFSSENYKFKVRGNWFVAVRNNFENAARMKIFPEEFNKEWRSFFKAYGEKMSKSGVWENVTRTTKEDIDTANNFLLKAQEIINLTK